MGRERRGRRLLVWGLVVVGVVGTVLVGGPTLLGQLFSRQLTAALGVPVRVAWISLSPFGPTIALHDVTISAPADGRVVAIVRALRADVALRETLGGTPALDELVLDRPWLDLQRTASGDFNVVTLLAPADSTDIAPESPNAPVPAPAAPLRIGALRLEGGTLKFHDEASTPPLDTSLYLDSAAADDLRLTLAGEGKVEVKIASRLGKDSFTLAVSYEAHEGDSDLHAVLETTSASLAGVLVHIPLGWGEVTGTLDATVDYRRTVKRAKLATHRVGVRATAHQLTVADVEEDRPSLRAKRVRLPGLAVDLVTQRIQLGTIEVDEFDVLVKRTEDGGLRIPLVSTSAGDADSPWRTELKAVVLGSGALTLRDLPPGAPDIAAKVRSGRVTARENLVAFQLATNLAGGTVNLDGRVESGTTIDLVLDGVSVPELAAHLGSPIAFASGTVAGTLHAEFRDGPPRFSGHLVAAGVKNAPGPDHPEEVFAWAKLTFDLADSTFAPPALHVTRAVVEWPYLMVHRRSDGVYPFASADAAEPVASATPAADGAAPLLVVDRVEVVGGRIEFYDTVLATAYGADLIDVAGSVEGLRMAPLRVERFALDGTIDELSPVTARGSYGGPRSDASLTVTRLMLAPLAPYLEPPLGYEVTAGFADLSTGITRQDPSLRADNTIEISRLAMRSSGPDPFIGELGVPLTVALSLMKDSSGRIDLDLPLEIDLNTQEYRLRVFVLDALRRAFLGALKTPLRMLGSVFRSRQSERFDLKPVPFAPGSAELDGDGTARIAEVARLLQRHTNLSVVLLPHISSADATALAQAEGTTAAPAEALSALGATRAEAVARSLREDQGVVAERVTIQAPDRDQTPVDAPSGVDVQLRGP